jgi:hypothetical protein
MALEEEGVGEHQEILVAMGRWATRTSGRCSLEARARFPTDEFRATPPSKSKRGPVEREEIALGLPRVVSYEEKPNVGNADARSSAEGSDR